MRILSLCALALCAGAAEIGVDQPHEWWSPQASHHGKHFMGGAALGLTVGAATRVVTDSETASYVLGVGGTLVAATWYEVRVSRNGALIDPVDIAWTTLGSVAGVALGNLTYDAITVRASRGEVALAARFAW